MKRKKIIPECWEELTSDQFVYLLRKVFVMMENPAITKDDVLRDFADYILGRRHYINPWLKNDYLLLVNEAAKIMEWIFSLQLATNANELPVIALDYNSVHNLIPEYRGLKGPQSAGFDLRFKEYRTACWMYNNYTVEHDIDSLNGLVGILYRKEAKTTKPSFNGDFREPFNQYHLAKYAKRVAYWPEHIKWGIYLWFGYFCQYLMTGDFSIEGNDISFAPLFSAESDPEGKRDDSLGMTSILFTLAESRTFGNVDETDNALLFKVMLKLLNDDITAKNLKHDTNKQAV
jgi:hypothetical protein